LSFLRFLQYLVRSAAAGRVCLSFLQWLVRSRTAGQVRLGTTTTNLLDWLVSSLDSLGEIWGR
jgi:hypothetical protein